MKQGFNCSTYLYALSVSSLCSGICTLLNHLEGLAVNFAGAAIHDRQTSLGLELSVAFQHCRQMRKLQPTNHG